MMCKNMSSRCGAASFRLKESIMSTPLLLFPFSFLTHFLSSALVIFLRENSGRGSALLFSQLESLTVGSIHFSSDVEFFSRSTLSIKTLLNASASFSGEFTKTPSIAICFGERSEVFPINS